MLKTFVSLQWKSFFRAASFQTNLAIKILMGFMALYFIFIFTMLGVFSFKIISEQVNDDPLRVVNRILIFYLVADLVMRYLLQRMPVVNIKPLLVLPFSKNRIVHFSLWKTVISFFNVIHAFFFLPFFIVLLKEGYPPMQAFGWFVMVTALIFSNNFINIFLNDVDKVFYGVLGLFAVLALLMYYGVFDVTQFIAPVFDWVYDHPLYAIIPVILLGALYYGAFRYFRNRLFLDDGLQRKAQEISTEDLSWLDRFGSLAVFLKNDIKLIKRNKRSRTSVLMSFFFLFYGLLFFSGTLEVYEGPTWSVFAGIFVTGGFLFTFGQFVPSWDSSYYPLMMSQNIKYRDYLNSKWWLIVIGTLISTVLASFYLYYGWEVYLAIVVAAIYNLGVNSHMVLWGGAYIKTPIDLTSARRAFGDKQAFNLKTMLFTIPKLLLPMALYGAGHYTLGANFGYFLVALAGIIGFAFKDKVFDLIEKVYKSEKYKTLVAYKQNS